MELAPPASNPVDADLDDSRFWLLPCQFDPRPIPLAGCPMFSQTHDQAGFSMPMAGGELHFRARYAHLQPLRIDGQTLVLVSGRDAAAEGHVAVLRPMPGKQFARSCLLRATIHDNRSDLARRGHE